VGPASREVPESTIAAQPSAQKPVEDTFLIRLHAQRITGKIDITGQPNSIDFIYCT
jgi:hypothetical protein